MTTRQNVIAWLRREIAEHEHMQRQHETVRDNPTTFLRTETGRIMTNARRALLGVLRLELAEQEDA